MYGLAKFPLLCNLINCHISVRTSGKTLLQSLMDLSSFHEEQLITSLKVNKESNIVQPWVLLLYLYL